MRYELKKLATGGTAVLLALCVALNAFLFYRQQAADNGSLLQDYPYYLALLEQLQRSPETPIEPAQDVAHAMAAYTAGEQQRHLTLYPDFIRNMPARAEAAANLSGRDAYSLCNIDKTTRDFAGLEALPIRAGRDLGVTAAYRFPLSDILLLALILVLCVKLFSAEYERRLFPLLLATPSRMKIARQKICALGLVVFLVSAALFGGNLLISGALYGFGDLGRPVQSVSAFRTCNLRLSCLGYLWAGFFIKLFAAFAFALLVFMAFTLLKRAVTVFFAAACFFGVSLGLYFGIGVTSSLNALHFVNAIHMMDSFSLLSRYQNINLFGQPVSMTQALPAVLAALIVCAAAVILLRFRSAAVCRAPGQLQALARLLDRAKKQADRLNHHGVVFLHELRKVMLGGRALFFLPALTLVLLYNYSTSYRLVDSVSEEYGNYIQKIGGPITDETLAFFDAEREFLAHVDTPENYTGRAEALSRVEAQVQRVLQSAEALQITPYLIDEAGYLKLAADRSADFFDCLLILVSATLCCAGIFARENTFGTKKLLRICKGGNHLLRCKLLLCLSLPVLAAAMVCTARFLIVAKDYALQNADAPVQSVTALAAFPLPLSIFEYLLLLCALRLLGALLTGCALAAISGRCKSDATSIAAATGLLAAPVAAVFAGAEALRYLTVFPLSGGNSFLLDAWPGQLWCLLFAVSGATGCLLLARQGWKKRA